MISARGRHVILCTLGTRGDIAPFAALARVLLALGARVTVLTNENWQDLIIAAGADFFSISPPDPSQSGRDDLAFFEMFTLPSYQASFDFVARICRQGGSPVLVGRSHMLGIEVAAKKFGLRHVNVVLQPSSIPSCVRPSWPLARLALGPAGAISARTLIPWAYHVGEWLSPYRKQTSAFRRANGSSPPARSVPSRVPGDLVALLCPDWFATPASDWQHNLRCFGFPLADEADVAGLSSVIDFLREGPPTIVATPGTGVTNVRDFSARMRQVAHMRGLRLLLISPYAVPGPNDVDVLIHDYLPLRCLLPYAELLVHHGGIGTVAAAIAAGCKQLVLAGRFDQPDNGVRIARFGLGGAILRSDPSVALIGQAVDRIRTSKFVMHQVRSASLQVNATRALADLACEILAS